MRLPGFKSRWMIAFGFLQQYRNQSCPLDIAIGKMVILASHDIHLAAWGTGGSVPVVHVGEPLGSV